MSRRIALCIALLTAAGPAGAEEMQASRISTLIPGQISHPPVEDEADSLPVFMQRVPVQVSAPPPGQAAKQKGANENTTGKSIAIPLLENGIQEANIRMLIGTEDDLRVEAADIKAWARDNLSASAADRLDPMTSPDGTLHIKDTPQAGFTLTFDSAQVVLQVVPEPDSLKAQSLSLTNDYIAPSQVLLAPAKVSGFLNMRGGETYIDGGVNSAANDNSAQSRQLDLDGAVNLKDWVLEGGADYTSDSPKAWERNDVRVIHDLPDKMVRLAAGDLSYPVSGFQSYQSMLGVSIARNFSLQPYRVTEPTGQTSFVIRTPSRVDVIVNGQQVRSLQLNPGPYDISDFPAADGGNDVTLVITDTAGNVERKTFPFLSDQKLLKAGLNEYAYNIGVESQINNRSIDYQTGHPAFSAFHRYGVSDTFTAGASVQGDENVQQAGMSALTAHSWGTIGLDTGVSRLSGFGTGTAADLSYSFHLPEQRRDFSSSLKFQSPDFAALGQSTPSNAPVWQATARYDQPIPYDIMMGIGGTYRHVRAGMEDDWSTSVNFNRIISRAWTANLTLQQRHSDGSEIYLAMTWAPPLSHHSVTTSADTLTHTQDVRWNWNDGHDPQMFQASAGVSHQSDRNEGTGSLNYAGYRAEASVEHDVAVLLNKEEPAAGQSSTQTETQSRTTVRGGTALVFADGHAAFSRPVNGSFIMLPRHNNLDGHEVGINPTTEQDGQKSYQAVIDGLGPAVLSDATPYVYRPVRIDTSYLPAGYDIGTDNYVALPRYKGGAVMVVGNAANIYADGHILFKNGTKASLVAGTISSESNPAFTTQEFFTNTDGRFRISHLEAGIYKIRLYQYPDAPLALTIPDSPAGRFDAGSLTLRANPP